MRAFDHENRMGITAVHELLWFLILRDLKARYRRSTMGLLWTMLQPLLNMLVLTTVFSSVFRFDIVNYPVYALSGILFWNFFQQGIVSSMNSLRGNASLLQKLAVPRAVFPLAAVGAGTLNLCLALVPLLAILLVTGHPLRLSLLFLPVAVLLMALFTAGFGLLLSPLAVFFFDVVEMLAVVLTLLAYLTPIFYPMTIVPPHWQWVIRFNPLRCVLEVFRYPIYNGSVPPAACIVVAVVAALASLAIGAAVFRKVSDRIPFYI
jgi:ABC-type polysaccharide/polyol phosphate export permease